MYDIIIDNTYATKYDLYVINRINIPVSIKNVKTISVLGRNGVLTREYGYLDRTITVDFNFKIKDREDNMSKIIRNITSWLINAKKITFSDDKEVYYKVKLVSVSDIERNLRVLGKFSVTFTIEPFAYYAPYSKLVLTNSTKIFNVGTFESEPLIKIFGTGTVNLNINNKTVTLKDVDGYIEIDSEIKETHKNFVSMNNKKVGEYPVFNVGENTISWTGNVTKIEIEPRWRFI